jgi:hypothetical protein
MTTTTASTVLPLRYGLCAVYITDDQLPAQNQADPPPDNQTAGQRRRATAAARSRARAPKAAT